MKWKWVVCVWLSIWEFIASYSYLILLPTIKNHSATLCKETETLFRATSIQKYNSKIHRTNPIPSTILLTHFHTIFQFSSRDKSYKNCSNVFEDFLFLVKCVSIGICPSIHLSNSSLWRNKKNKLWKIAVVLVRVDSFEGDNDKDNVFH